MNPTHKKTPNKQTNQTPNKNVAISSHKLVKWCTSTNLKPHQLEFPADEELDILDALTHLSHTEGAKNADVHEDPGAGIFFSFDRLLLAWTAFSHLKIDGWKTTFISSWFWPTFKCYISFEGCTFFPPNIHKPYFFHGFLDLKKPISVLQPTKLTTNTESFPWKIAGKGRRRLLGITWNNFFHEDRLPRTFRIPFGKWSSKPGNEFLFWELDNENGFQVPFSSARLPQFKQSPNRACSVTGGMYRGVPSWGWMITPFP